MYVIGITSIEYPRDIIIKSIGKILDKVACHVGIESGSLWWVMSCDVILRRYKNAFYLNTLL